MKYAFILGRKNLLATAELCHVLTPQDRIIDIQRETLIADLSSPLSEPQQAINVLGGTVKIGLIFAELSLKSGEEDAAGSAMLQWLLDQFKERGKKILYGVSAYNFSHQSKKIIKNSLLFLKKSLKEEGVSGRFINKGFVNLNNAAIKGESLIRKGAEILIIRGGGAGGGAAGSGAGKVYLARTVALQDFEGYSHRDYERPQRDAKLGMLPPKLAQIMINLAGYTTLAQTQNSTSNEKSAGAAQNKPLPQHLTKTIYDPFVGVGTVPGEAYLMGLNVIGSDLEHTIIEKARLNMEWLQKEWRKKELRTGPISPLFDSANPKNELHLFPHDATALNPQTLVKNSISLPIDAIVTESYLGPPLSQTPPPALIEKNFAYINQLISRFFRALLTILKPGTPIIISLPSYRINSRNVSPQGLPSIIKNLGFTLDPLIPRTIQKQFNIPSPDALIYDRPDQIVTREIFRFIKK